MHLDLTFSNVEDGHTLPNKSALASLLVNHTSSPWRTVKQIIQWFPWTLPILLAHLLEFSFQSLQDNWVQAESLLSHLSFCIYPSSISFLPSRIIQQERSQRSLLVHKKPWPSEKAKNILTIPSEILNYKSL